MTTFGGTLVETKWVSKWVNLDQIWYGWFLWETVELRLISNVKPDTVSRAKTVQAVLDSAEASQQDSHSLEVRWSIYFSATAG